MKFPCSRTFTDGAGWLMRQQSSMSAERVNSGALRRDNGKLKLGPPSVPKSTPSPGLPLSEVTVARRHWWGSEHSVGSVVIARSCRQGFHLEPEGGVYP